MLNKFDFVIRGRKLGAIGITYDIPLYGIVLDADTVEAARERLFDPKRTEDEFFYSHQYELDRIISCKLSSNKSGVRAMTRSELLAIFEQHGLKVDCERITTGTETAGFRTFEVGTGANFDVLVTARHEIKKLFSDVAITFVNNREHPQYNKPYLCVESFWVGVE